MKPKTMILMVVAVACGLVASYMTSRLLAERSAPPPENLVSVVLTKPGKRVVQYTRIKKPDDFFEVQQVPEGPLTAKAIKSLEELQNKSLNKTLNEQTIVRVDDLQSKADNPIEIPPGQRAIGIQVNAKNLAGGFILPGARVDLLCTIRQGDQQASMILLQNMLVLAVDQAEKRADEQRTILGSTVTLAATPEECQRINLAATESPLCLTLRNPDDRKFVTVGGSKHSDLFKQPQRGSGPDGDTVGADGSGEYVSPGNLPKIGPEPPLPTPEPQVVEEKKQPEPPPAKTHTLTVQMGPYTQRFMYTQASENGEWQTGVTRTGDDDPPPAKQKALAPAVQPEKPATDLQPADNGKKKQKQ